MAERAALRCSLNSAETSGSVRLSTATVSSSVASAEVTDGELHHPRAQRSGIEDRTIGGDLVLASPFPEGGQASSGGGEHGKIFGGLVGQFGDWGTKQPQPGHPEHATGVGFPGLVLEVGSGPLDHLADVVASIPPAYIALCLTGDQRKSAKSERPRDCRLSIIDGGRRAAAQRKALAAPSDRTACARSRAALGTC